MEITSLLKSLSTRTLAWITLFLVIVTLAISLLCGTLLISLEKNSESLYLLIRHTAHLQSINKSVVLNVHSTCRAEPQTFVVHPWTWEDFGKSLNNTMLNMVYQRKLSILPFTTLPSKNYGSICTHFKDLNRFLNLGLYILVDSSIIMVNSLTLNVNILCFNASQTMDCYLALMDLKQKINSWATYNMMERYIVAEKVQGQIFATYKFDISKHYKVKKYGNYYKTKTLADCY